MDDDVTTEMVRADSGPPAIDDIGSEMERMAGEIRRLRTALREIQCMRDWDASVARDIATEALSR